VLPVSFPAPSSRYMHLLLLTAEGLTAVTWGTHEPETRTLFTLSAKGRFHEFTRGPLGPLWFRMLPIFCFLIIATHTFPHTCHSAPAPALRGVVHAVPPLLALDPSSVCARSCSSHLRRFQQHTLVRSEFDRRLTCALPVPPNFSLAPSASPRLSPWNCCRPRSAARTRRSCSPSSRCMEWSSCTIKSRLLCLNFTTYQKQSTSSMPPPPPPSPFLPHPPTFRKRATHSFTLRFPPNKPPRALDSHDADIDTYLLRWKTLRKYCAAIPSVQILIFDCPPERSWAGAEPLIVTFITTTREYRRKNCRIFVLLLDTNPSGTTLIFLSPLLSPSPHNHTPPPPTPPSLSSRLLTSSLCIRR
jgi:hypothetical protein